jgi:hypothetical protein
MKYVDSGVRILGYNVAVPARALYRWEYDWKILGRGKHRGYYRSRYTTIEIHSTDTGYRKVIRNG